MPDFLSYVGAFTGVAGLVLSGIALRRTHTIKRFDVQVEIKRGLIDAGQLVAAAEDLLPKVNQSRTRVLAATQGANSGAALQWNQQNALYEQRLAGVKGDNTRLNASAMPKNLDDLAQRLVDVHDLKMKASELATDFKAELTKDDRRREEIRQSMSEVLGPARASLIRPQE